MGTGQENEFVCGVVSQITIRQLVYSRAGNVLDLTGEGEEVRVHSRLDFLDLSSVNQPIRREGR